MTDQPTTFQVRRRNFGHWDIVTSDSGRLFALRGGPSRWYVRDERGRRDDGGYEPRPAIHFKDQAAAFAWIIAEMTWEPLRVEGQPEGHVMEAWNV